MRFTIRLSPVRRRSVGAGSCAWSPRLWAPTAISFLPHSASCWRAQALSPSVCILIVGCISSGAVRFSLLRDCFKKWCMSAPSCDERLWRYGRAGKEICRARAHRGSRAPMPLACDIRMHACTAELARSRAHGTRATRCEEERLEACR